MIAVQRQALLVFALQRGFESTAGHRLALDFEVAQLNLPVSS